MSTKLPEIFRADGDAVAFVDQVPVGTKYTSPNNFFLNEDGTMAFAGNFDTLLVAPNYSNTIGIGRDLQSGKLLMYIPINSTYRWRVNMRKGYTLYPCDVVIVG